DLFGVAAAASSVAAPADSGPATSAARVPPVATEPPPQSAVERALREIDPDRMTPIDALLAIARLRKLLG
nr:hypothetical protein [Myxococcota bacterium]